MVDLSSKKIEILARNSNPVAPSSTNGGNISHRDEQYNGALTAIELALNTLSGRIDALESGGSGGGSDSGSGSSSGSSYVWTGDLTSDVEQTIFTLTEDITIEKIIVKDASDVYSLEFYTPTIYFDINTYDVGATGIDITLTSPTFVASGSDIIAYTASATQTGITVELVTS